MVKKATPKKKLGKTSPKASARISAKAAQKPARKAQAAAKRPARKSPLGKSELDEFRKMLLAKRRALIGDMNGIEAEALRNNRQAGSGDLSNMPTHPADVGTDNYEQEFSLGLLESERQLLKEINEAIERVDAGNYGVCLGTGQFIGKPRLKARPWAKYCIEYAKLLEKGLVRPGDENHPDSADEDELEEDEVEEEVEAEPEDGAPAAEDDLEE